MCLELSMCIIRKSSNTKENYEIPHNLILLQTRHNEVNSDFGISVNPTIIMPTFLLTPPPPLTLCESFLIFKFIVNGHILYVLIFQEGEFFHR